MALPSRLVVQQCLLALDGGSRVILAIDEGGSHHSITLGQHIMPKYDPSHHRIPGRLVFDDTLVPIRSEQEAEVMRILRSAEVRDIDRPVLVEVIRFVESDEYLSFAARVEQSGKTS